MGRAYSSPYSFERTNRPLVNGDYALQETDLGAALTVAGSACTAPTYSTTQDGPEYGITNLSDGTVTFAAAAGEFILQKLQQVTSISIPSGESRQMTRNSTNHAWIIV